LKNYVDAHRVDRSYKVENRVFLRVKSHKSLINLGKGDKLSPWFMGPFEIVERKGPMAYRLALPDSLRCMYYVAPLEHLVHPEGHVAMLMIEE
jgi:hypothetical protein